MIDLKTLLIETDPTSTTWEDVGIILGLALIISEAIIRMYMHNSKMKKEMHKADNGQLSEAELANIKNLQQTVMNNTNKISGLEIQHKNMETSIDELKALIRDVERDNFTSLSSVSDKIDILKNILLEAKMNSKK